MARRSQSLIARSRESQEPLALRGFPLAPSARGDARYQVDVSLTPLAGPGPLAGSVLLEIANTTEPSRMTRDNALLVQQGGSRIMARQLAHEIKNPLGGLRGAAQLLERELPSAELKEYTRVIIGEADRLCALVDSLLGPARAVRREAVNVHELIDHVYRLARAEAPAGVAIERDYDPSLPALRLDRDLMVQAMLNLARNAVQALGERGLLTLRSRAHDERDDRRRAPPRGRLAPVRGQRPRRAAGTRRNNLLSARDRARGRHRAWPCGRAGHRDAPRRNHRVRQPAGTNRLFAAAPHGERA